MNGTETKERLTPADVAKLVAEFLAELCKPGKHGTMRCEAKVNDGVIQRETVVFSKDTRPFLGR